MTHSFYTYNAKIIDVYDGDTCKAVIDLGFNMTSLKTIRLIGIDTPELRGDELEAGRIVRDIVRSMILGKDVVLHTYKDKTGKYGRYLAEIWVDDVNLNDWLLENGHAKVYGS